MNEPLPPHPFESGDFFTVWTRSGEGWRQVGSTRNVLRNFGRRSECVFVHVPTGKRYRRNGEELPS